MNKVSLTSTAPLTIAATLIIAPLYLGSYYDEYRWPAIYLACLASTLCLITAIFSKSKHRTHKPTIWLTTLCCLTIGALGVFMWHNSWGELSVALTQQGQYIDFEITPKPSQPYYNLPGSADEEEAWDKITYIIPCLLLIITSQYLTAKKLLNLKLLSSTLFWTGVSVAILGLTQRFTEAESMLWNDRLFDRYQPLFFATFRSPGIATCYLNITLSLGLSHLLSTTNQLLQKGSKKPTHPLLITIGILLIFTGSIAAGSKAGAALALLTISLWTLLNIKGVINTIRNASSLLPSGSPLERNIILTATFTAITLATLSFGGIVSERWERAHDNEFRSLTTRQTANTIQLEMIADPQWSKIAGFGPGSFYPMFHFYKGDRIPKETLVYAHNDHLQTLVEWGYIGTGCFIILIGGGGTIILFELFARRKRHRTNQVFYLRGMSIAMIICLTHATVDFPFQIESIAMTFSVILGVAWASPSLRLRQKTTQQ